MEASKGREEPSAAPSRFIEMRLESGGFNQIVYWSATIVGQPDGTSTIRVVRQEPLEEKPGQIFEGQLTKPATKKLWQEAKRVSVWTLPKTNYQETMTDDCYHLGELCV